VSAPLVVSAFITPSEEDGSTAKAIEAALTDTYASRVDHVYGFTTGGTTTVPLGTLPAIVKAVLVHYQSATGSPTLAVALNAAAPLVVSPGGFLVLTRTTITGLSLTYTAAAKVRVLLLG